MTYRSFVSKPKKAGFMLLLFLGLFQFCILNAQKTAYHVSSESEYQQAKELYDKEKYNTAQKLFQSVYDANRNENSVIRTLSQFYVAQCAVRLFNADAEFLTMQFVSDNPESPLVNEAYFSLGGYFYTLKKWGESIDSYNKVDWQKLNKEQQAEFFFKQGYSYFSKNDFEAAKLNFYEIKDQKSKYTAPATYYYSHIHYKEENYQTALNGFLRIVDDKTFGPVVPYYIVQIYYMQGKYEEITTFVPGIIDNVTEQRLDEVTRIAAEAFFRLEKYNEAIDYFRRYTAATKSPAPEATYQFGYAWYKTNQIDSAIFQFEKISYLESAIGQNASYYLASCYLKKDQKENARKAFASASRSNYDPVIKQDAMFNYALLTYEIGGDPFNDAIKAFEDFIAAYPESKRIDEARRMLIQSYLNARNYKKALASIDKVENKNSELKEAYQRIAFNRGIELFNNQEYREATEMFRNSQKYTGFNALREARANYWLGESLYREKNYAESIKAYKRFKDSPSAHTVSEFSLVDYNLGYAYYKSGNYSEAANHFRQFAGNKTESGYLSDTYVRLADCYFMLTQYMQAIDFYQRAIDAGYESKDYALMQKAMCQGLAKKEIDKITTLKQLAAAYPNSVYADNAWYEIAQEYLKLQDSKQAIDALNTLQNKYPQSEVASKALVQLGLLYYNNDNNDQAIKYYKLTVTKYPGTQEAKDALFGLKNIYIDLGRIDEYTAFVDGLGGSSYVPQLTINEKDSLTYIAAEKLYMSANCTGAISAFEKYLSSFPNGAYVLSAKFYSGDCYYQSRQYDKAVFQFEYVISQPSNKFTEQALLGCARIAVARKDNERIPDYYGRLLSISSSQANIKEANIAILRAYYAKNQFEQALSKANDVLALPSLSDENKREAGFVKARSLHQMGREALALESYRELSAEVLSVQGAESKFRVAEILLNQKKYDEAEKEILDFSTKSTSHDYWVARSFILWSDIFVARQNNFQAIETLQSIIDYYENMNDGILDMAKSRKAAIESVNKKAPASNEPDEVNIENKN